MKRILELEGYEIDIPIGINDYLYIDLESECRFISKDTKINIDVNWNFEGIILVFQQSQFFIPRFNH